MKVAIDSSSLVAYLAGNKGEDIELIDKALVTRVAALPPVVLTEILSTPNLPQKFVETIRSIPTLLLETGYWERAAETRGKVLKKGYKARLADTLIAQTCLDHDVPLITRDKDFRHFAKITGLIIL